MNVLDIIPRSLTLSALLALTVLASCATTESTTTRATGDAATIQTTAGSERTPATPLTPSTGSTAPINGSPTASASSTGTNPSSTTQSSSPTSVNTYPGGANGAPRGATVPHPFRIGLALGGGAARGFAHIGVIKALEAQGIDAQVVVGTSAGSVVGALYASGLSGFDLQQLSLKIDESQFSDWSLPNRGVIKGELLQDFVNKTVKGVTLEHLSRTFGCIATDLRTGEMVVFRTGNTGAAVRASSSVPGVFQPIQISGHDYVDGGLVSPVPVKVARSIGADFVIAVDISSKPRSGHTDSSLDVIGQSITIMEAVIAQNELKQADVVIRPDVPELSIATFEDRHRAILEGERAVAAILPELKEKLARARASAR